MKLETKLKVGTLKNILAILFLGCLFDFQVLKAQDAAVEQPVGVSSSDSALFVIVGENGKKGYMDKTGKIIIQPQFDVEWAYNFSEGLAPIEVGGKKGFVGRGKFGYIDKTGNMVIKVQFDMAYGFSEGLAAVKINDKWGFIDKKGNIVIKPQHKGASIRFSEGLASVEISVNELGYIDKTGKMVITIQGSLVGIHFGTSKFSEGLANVKDGYIDKTGDMVIDNRFTKAFSFSEGLAQVEVGGKRGYIDKAGNMVIQPQFDPPQFLNEGHFSEGLAAVKIDNKWGFIDKKGNMVIKPQYEKASDFSEGLAAVKLGDKWGYIDKTGNMLIAQQYKYAHDFSNGLAKVRVRTNYWGYIDKTGEFVWSPRHKETGEPLFKKLEALAALSSVQRTEQLVEIVEEIEAGRQSENIPDPEDLEEVITELDVYLKAHPEEVHALILFARLGRFVNVSKPMVITPGKEMPSFESGYAPLHAALDQALKLEPNNAEAHYWKARLYGIRVPDLSADVMKYRSLDLGKAVSSAKRAVEFAPENIAYKEALALYLVGKQKPEEAIEILRDVESGRHPIYLLLKDMQALPIPDGAVYLPENSEGFAQMHMASGAIRDYPNLRVYMYMLPMPADEVETFYRRSWPKFRLFEMQSEKYEGGETLRVFAQYLRYEKGVLQPASKKKKIPDSPNKGIILTVTEFQNVSPETRNRFPAFDGDVMCILAIINYREF